MAKRKPKVKAPSVRNASGHRRSSDRGKPSDQMTEDQRNRIDDFIRSYLIDWNHRKAAMRIGVSAVSAATVGKRWLESPYVQQRIIEIQDRQDEKFIVNRNRVLGGYLREANNYGMDANSMSRLQAWRAIAKVLGMEREVVEIKASVAHVMHVPFAKAPEWEVLVEAEQKKLTEMSRG